MSGSNIGQEVTIRTYRHWWVHAKVVGEGQDSFMGEHQVLVVRHPALTVDLEFYAEPAEDGKRYYTGNCAYWLVFE